MQADRSSPFSSVSEQLPYYLARKYLSPSCPYCFAPSISCPKAPSPLLLLFLLGPSQASSSEPDTTHSATIL
ncbi:hypothetical protein V496_05306 [Pseudogymnoascus sp. VKM F-4515 (FW-2607)]|nr:hypothetical protein V496_05306 [Pseudogymnoascus sp. VKM F-4515 (FW-2607)]